MKVLVVGLPKSGTTVLTYRIASALDDVTIEFEPPGGPEPDLADRSANIVTKKLVGSQTVSLAEFAHYDRKIWICRDPRDFLVSQSLYRWHREVPPTGIDQVWFDRVFASLLAKEADPSSVPFASLEPADYSHTFDAVSDLWSREGDRSWLLYRYEDMVLERYQELNDHLGFEIDPGATVGSGLERVVRRKAAGDWRDWFTDQDVAHYAAGGLEHYMHTFGYDHDDWALNPDPRIDPAHGSAYVHALFHDHRPPGVDGSQGQEVETASPDESPTRGLLGRLLSLGR